MIRSVLFHVVLILSTGFHSALAVIFGWMGGGRTGIDGIHRSWARSMLAVAGVRVSVRGLEYLDCRGPQIIVANHQSYFDIWALLAALPASVRFVAKGELARIPVLAKGMRLSGHVLIDRGNPRGARATFRIAGDRMRRDGLSLVLFPEGTRSRDGALGRFLRGSFALALETRVPLVPAAVVGGHRVYPPGARRVSRGRISVRLAPPICLDGVDPPDRAALMRETRAVIEAMLEEGGEVRRTPK